ncbi:MAG TPA: hypothetical protein VIF63_08455 [Candidatus Limnocylindrales bacterium]
MGFLDDLRNDPPAEGGLDAVPEPVGTTPQRQKVVARLRWAPARTESDAPTALRSWPVAVALAAAIVVTAIVVGSGPGQIRTWPFEGMWTSLDPTDGSTQTLVVGPGDTPPVRFEDDFGVDGLCVEDPTAFIAEGAGAIRGNHLDVSFPDGGGCVGVTAPVADMAFDLEATTGELLGADGRTWSLLTDATAEPTAPAATDGPATDSPATDAPSATGVQATSAAVVTDAIATQGVLDPSMPTGATIRIRYMPTPATTIQATRFQIAVPADFDVRACDAGTLKLWRTTGNPIAPDVTIAPGQVMTIWVLNVDNQPLVFTAAVWPDEMTPALRDFLNSFREGLFLLPR